jgi:molecular chaperone DnaK
LLHLSPLNNPMANETIQIGIDLGTTNSEVAAFMAGKVEVIKNVYQDAFTPSVFGADKAGNKVVGKKAYENLFKKATDDEVANNKAEVKRLMGTSDKIDFPRLNAKLTPEEVSAEILRSLKEDVGRKYPDLDLAAAVITVPAYFSILQSEATKRAGDLAGFDHVVLLQEPIAAAIAYGFQASENQNWLVYDLGGGTFDVALISSKDGSLTVLESGGDNYLGGKNIDWLLVDEIIAPQIVKKYDLKDFNRSNLSFRTIFSRLKYLAESAKIDLSQLEKTLIEVDLETGDGIEISLNIEVTRSEFEKIIDPLIDKTVSIAKETIKNAGVSYSAVSKVILVGGPTQIPYLREKVGADLGIKVDTSIDCLTAVATGACLYGLSQRIPKKAASATKKDEGTVELKLNYSTLTSETDEPISGSIESGGDSSYTLQIQSEDGLYTSPRITLKGGKFIESITVEPNKTNQYWVYLFDDAGKPVTVSPDSFVITHGLSVSGAPIAHSIGIALQKQLTTASENSGEFDIFFEKGSILPLKEKTKRYRTAQKINRGDDSELPIIVVEGESANPQNNIFVCRLGINGKELPHDLTMGTDLDVTLSVNESRELSASYYIPSIDKGGNLRVSWNAEDLSAEDLKKELDKQKEKFAKVQGVCTEEEKDGVEKMISLVSLSVEGAVTDEDSKRQADSEIKQLRDKLEQLSEEKKGDNLKAEFKGMVELIGQLLQNAPPETDKEKAGELFATLTKEGDSAASSNNDILLARVNEQLVALAVQLYYANPHSWLEQLAKHSNGEFKYTNPQAAQYFLEKGKKAVEANNIEGVKDAVKELQNLMVNQKQAGIGSMLSGLTH